MLLKHSTPIIVGCEGVYLVVVIVKEIRMKLDPFR